MTVKENYLATFEHKTPEWLSNGMMDVNFLLPMQEIERYDDMESGEDGFGVHWTYDENPVRQCLQREEFYFRTLQSGRSM